MGEAAPVWQLLQSTCRQAGIEVMYTVMESLTLDGRDRSLDYKISGGRAFSQEDSVSEDPYFCLQ